jgi:hypothetical protein
MYQWALEEVPRLAVIWFMRYPASPPTPRLLADAAGT